MSPPATFDQLPADAAVVLEVLLREFEQHVSAGKVKIDEFAAVVAEPFRPAVRDELEAIAAEYAARGTAPASPDSTQPHHTATQPTPYRPTGVPYRLGRVLGRGGFGVVFEAFDESLGRTVALKVLRSPGGTGGDTLGTSSARFRDEARRLARLRHENIVQVHDTDLDDNGVPFMVMEFVPRTLNDLIVERPKPGAGDWSAWARRVAVVVRDLSHAVASAHDAGIIHGDLKPANVLLDGDRPKLADFGASRLRELSGEERGAAMGTPSFMAPEQIPGVGTVTERTDVYGLGAILYTCLTGRPPFPADPDSPLRDTPAILGEVQNRPPRPVRESEPRTPAALAAICEKCLAKEPADRYASATELAAELDRWLTFHPVGAYRHGPFERVGLWRRRNVSRSMGRVLTGIVAVVAVGTVAASLGFAKYQSGRVAEERRLNGELDARADALRTTNETLRETNTKLDAENKRNSLHARALEQLGGPIVSAVLVAHHDPTRFKERSLNALVRGMKAFDGVPKDDLSPETRRMVAFGYLILGHKELEANRPKESEVLFRLAVPMLERVVRDQPTDREARDELATALYLLGAQCRDTNRPDEWRKLWDQSLKLSEGVFKEEPESQKYRTNLGRMYFNLGAAAQGDGKFDEFEKLMSKSLAVLASETAPGTPDAWFVSEASWARAATRAARKEYVAALDDYARAVRFHPGATERKDCAGEAVKECGPHAGEPGVSLGLARVSAAAGDRAAVARHLALAVVTDGLFPTLAGWRRPDFAGR